MNQSFSYNQRIHSPSKFAITLKNKAIIDKWLAIHCAENAEGYDRLGIIVSKRIVAKASARNRLKRYIREAFRKCLGTNIVSCDIVVRLRKEVKVVETGEFQQKLTHLLKKVRMANHDSPCCNTHKRLSISN